MMSWQQKGDSKQNTKTVTNGFDVPLASHAMIEKKEAQENRHRRIWCTLDFRKQDMIT